jgi:hypothetical protein
MPAKQIPLNQILKAIDNKDRNFYDNLDDDHKKGFSPFIMLRYASSVNGDSDLEHYYIAGTNHYANPSMLESPLSKHPKLQWLLFTAVSPGIGIMNHRWIKQKPKPKNKNNEIVKILSEIHPAMKQDDLEVLANFVTKKELKQYAKDCGEK